MLSESLRNKIAALLGIKPQVVEVVKTKIELVEVPNIRTQKGWDSQLRETVTTLQAHPGFLALCERLDLQAAALRTKLNNERHASLRDVEFIQSGIYWCNWLRGQVNMATIKAPQRRQEAAEEDYQAIKEIEASFEKIG